jgi:hypothetical protein
LKDIFSNAAIFYPDSQGAQFNGGGGGGCDDKKY